MSIGIALSVLFAVLKLTGVVGWTWLTVAVPFIVEVVIDALIILALVLLGGFAVVFSFIDK